MVPYLKLFAGFNNGAEIFKLPIMQSNSKEPRRDFIKKSLTGAIAMSAGLTAAGTMLQSFTGKDETHDPTEVNSPVTAKDFRAGVMPRAQLSMQASKLAVDKATQKDTKEFAGWELMEAIAVINVLKDLGTPETALGKEGQDFLTKLKGLSGNEFDKTYMQAELSNHEFLRDFAKAYLDGSNSNSAGSDKETIHVANLALFAFTEHVGLSKRIFGELTA